MILKKPYAFLIRHFRLIHLILLGCNILFLWNMNKIHGLFTKLHNSGTYMYGGAINYVNNFLYLAIFVIIALSIILYVVLLKKKKPSFIYLLLLIYALISLFTTVYVFSLLKTIEETLIELDTLIFVNDLTFAIQIPAYFFIAICFIRGIGFNLKKFNFSKDIKSLDIAESDSEEFEFMIGQNNYKIFRKLRRFKRELIYYIIENKFSVFAVALTVFTILSCFGIYSYVNGLKKLKNNETADVNGIIYSVNYGFLTANDYLGKAVNIKHKYVVVNMTFYNASRDPKAIDLTKIFLYDGKSSYSPSMLYNSKFYDLGVPYVKDTLINSQASLTATLTFEVPARIKKKNFELRIQYEITDGILNQYVAKYKKFEVIAQNIDSADSVNDVSLKQQISIDLLGYNKFNIKIDDYKLEDLYENKYIVCKNIQECNVKSTIISAKRLSNMTMLEVDFKGLIYNKANFAKTFNTFNKIFNAYTQVEYTVNGKTFIEDGVIASDSEVDNKAFLIVPRNINNANSINLIFNFRNDKYKVLLS